ncbi:MAG: 5'/3'-nucleotidase SurE [Phormidesmis sp.]
MNVLVSNDDGIFALGIRALANALANAGHEVTVVCPDRERSATGHGLTLHKPLRVEPVEGVFAPEVTAWACSGTPSDCVKLALDAILPAAPDFVVSGINHGANLGTDVLYSGTVSAAMEGVLEGIPAIAISLTSFAYKNFQPAAEFAVQMLAQLEKQPLNLPILLNINVPPVAAAEIKGAVIARQGIRRYFDQFEKRTDPRGKIYYWLAGEVMEEGDVELPAKAEASQVTRLEKELSALSAQFTTDVKAIKDSYITVTPLQYNLTAYTALDFINTWQSDSFQGDLLLS